MHENAQKCLKMLIARALLVPNRIFYYGNTFSIKYYPKMTPINSYIKKNVSFISYTHFANGSDKKITQK